MYIWGFDKISQRPGRQNSDQTTSVRIQESSTNKKTRAHKHFIRHRAAAVCTPPGALARLLLPVSPGARFFALSSRHCLTTTRTHPCLALCQARQPIPPPLLLFLAPTCNTARLPGELLNELFTNSGYSEIDI